VRSAAVSERETTWLDRGYDKHLVELFLDERLFAKAKPILLSTYHIRYPALAALSEIPRCDKLKTGRSAFHAENVPLRRFRCCR